MLDKEVSELLGKVQQHKPLVHNMTNVVVTNFTANGLYALGASPVMAYSPDEVADMAKIAGALVLNIGTLSRELVDAMIIAGRSANAHGVPVLLDPVGAGATTFRTESALRILKEVQISLVRGNAAEVAHLVGESREIKGVDGGGSTGESHVSLAIRAAQELKTTVVITGEEDVITDGTTVRVISGGHELLTKVTGAGCLLTSVLGAFAAIEPDLMLSGAAGLAFYGAAAARAAELTSDVGPGSFQVAFIDELAKLHPGSLSGYSTIREEEVAGTGDTR
ncbi:hydroxyethylthiazole kinase [Paenibacillus sp. EC2-1]|uniref:hydroxyethylthiazole kinase n=1 Tax=Paenibacillus sp. EC2-1 TaxID=3388665 RepID=UPI003BEF142D